ncbi:MAG: hypothetical protein WKF75_03235 [Singulisphaera sp.]
MLADAKVEGLHRRFAPVGDRSRLRLIEATEDAKSYAAIEPVICSHRGGHQAELEPRRRRRGLAGHRLLHRLRPVPRGVVVARPVDAPGAMRQLHRQQELDQHRRYKNQLGTFNAPKRVFLAFDLLRTLPEDEIRSGMGEIIKLSLVAGPGSWPA